MKRISLVGLLLIMSSMSHAVAPKIMAEGISSEEIKLSKASKLAPRGSATITDSGKLKNQNIKAIIHAATGSMNRSGKNFDPSLESIELSVKNSVKLAQKNSFTSIAVPFLGSGIFISRIGTTKKKLAATIIQAMSDAANDIKPVFVAYGDSDYELAKDVKAKLKTSKVSIVKGSITDYSVHGAAVIVNAANTELVFGGGLSGVIARATGASDEIDKENKAILQSFAP